MSETTIDTTAAMEARRKEEALRFGDGVTVTYDPHFPVDNIDAPDDFNYRLKAGMVVNGIKVENDRRNIGGMAESIKALGGLTTPLVISKRADGTARLCQGYRRLNGIKLLRTQDPSSPLSQQLETVPCVIYEGLTELQERQLVNDQTSKFFTASEVFQIFKEHIDGGFGWQNTALRMYQQIGAVTGSMDKVRELDGMQDETKKMEALKEWLTTTVQQFWWNAIKAGPITTNLTLQTYMWKDGQTNIRPRVVMDSGRMRALQTQIKADRKEGKWNDLEGHGPKFNAKLAEMELADKRKYDKDPNAGSGNEGEKKPSLKKLTDVQGLIEDARKTRKLPEGQQGLVERLFRVVLKDGGDPPALRAIHNFDRCKVVYELHKDFLKPELVAVFDLIFDGAEGAEEQLGSFFRENSVTLETAPETETTPEPEPETTPEPEPVLVEAGAGMDAPKTETGKPKRNKAKKS